MIVSFDLNMTNPSIEDCSCPKKKRSIIDRLEQQTIMLKTADLGRSDFYVVFTMSLCAS